MYVCVSNNHSIRLSLFFNAALIGQHLRLDFNVGFSLAFVDVGSTKSSSCMQLKCCASAVFLLHKQYLAGGMFKVRNLLE